MKNSDTAIIIPVFNEAKVIRGVIDSIMKEFAVVICIDDGSTDDSAKEIAKTGAFLLRHPINMGQGAALQTGLEFALQLDSANYLVTFDADGQHRVQDVLTMLREIKNYKVDIVLGSRFLGETQNIRKLKKALLKAAVMFTNTSSGLNLTDTHNGLRVMTRQAASKMSLKMSDYTHASEIIERISQEKLSYMEVPVTIVYTDYSKSKGQSMINAINIAFDMIIQRMTGR